MVKIHVTKCILTNEANTLEASDQIIVTVGESQN